MTPPLIRAARGLLDWRQQDLAEAAGLSLTAIIKFERSEGKTRDATIQAMVDALRDKGIEFLPNGGVRNTEEITMVTRITGKDFVEKLNEDVRKTLTRPGDEIFSFSPDESQWFVHGMKDTADRYYNWRNKLGVKQYYIVSEVNAVFESPRSHYRVLPPELMGKIVFLIYGDRIAFVTIRKQQVFILRNREFAAPFREQFNFLWRMGRKV